MRILNSVVDEYRFTPKDVTPFEAKLFFEGARLRGKLETFAVLLLLSTVIATCGVIGDSTATVIGAMIIAPLMKPIMATAAGLVMGDLRRAGFSFLVAAAGAAMVIGVAWLMTKVMVIAVVSFETNLQITGRIAPKLIDLYSALAAGAAGAFAMSRDDVADSLPGVAIAIALVPPLCVVGIALAEGQSAAAGGAMLLFLTNFMSILLVGGGVFALFGLSSATFRELKRNGRARALGVVVIGVLLITIPLGATSWRVFEESQVKQEAIQSAQTWIGETGYEISRVDVSGDQVVLTIHGSGTRPRLSALGKRLGTLLDRPLNMQLIVIPSVQEQYAVEMD